MRNRVKIRLSIILFILLYMSNLTSMRTSALGNIKLIEDIPVEVNTPNIIIGKGIEVTPKVVRRPFILDVDMSSDVDDVCAVRMATQFHSEGIIDLKAVGYSVTGENDIAALRGILVHDGCSDVEMGRSSMGVHDESPYWNTMAAFSDGNNSAMDAVKLYRKILAQSSIGVDIVTTGYLTNIELLLKSGPDEYSELNGIELVAQKCHQLYVTGGVNPNGFDNNFFYGYGSINAIKYVNENWPASIIYFPSNVGGKCIAGDKLEALDKGNKDIVSKALRAFGTEYGRAAWDPFAVWCAAQNLNETTQVGLTPIQMIIHDDGSNTMIEDESGKHFAIYMLSNDLNYYNTMMNDKLIIKYTEKYN